jgi:uroporphyrinogen-III synthase
MKLALQGRRVLVTRPAHQAEKLAAPLRALGAEVILLPVLEVLPPSDPAPLLSAIKNLDSYRWIVLTSANAVRSVTDILRVHNKNLAAFSDLKIAVVGEETAQSVAELGRRADLIPPDFTAASLGAALSPHVSGQRVLLPQQPAASEIIADSLTAAGALLDRVDAYRTALPADASSHLRTLYANPATAPDVLTFTSAQSARNFFELLRETGVALPPNTVISSIGPSTTAALRSLGNPPQVAAAQSTAHALADALSRYFAG